MFRLGWLQTVAAFLSGTVLILTFIIGYVLPLPSTYQLSILRAVSGISAAALGYTLPGMVELKTEGPAWKAVRLAGALALFLLAYLLMPSFIRPVGQLSSPEKHLVCVGSPAGGCPEAAVKLDCNAGITDWAKSQCRSPFSITSLKTAAGGKCGFYIAEVACIRAPQ